MRLLGVAPDRQDAIAEALRAGLAADVLVVSGGVSAGDYDLVEPALLGLGAAFLFTKVAIKPGAPARLRAALGGTLVFGLPGNPVSAQVTFELFVRPALLQMQGARVLAAAPGRGRARDRRHEPLGPDEPRCPPACASRAGGSSPARSARRARATSPRTRGRTPSWCSRPTAPQAAAGETAEALLLGNFLEDDGAPL